MKRCALLYSFESIDEVYNSDVEKFRNFLLTAAGGSWSESEIVMICGGTKEGFLEIFRMVAEKSDFLLFYCSLQCGTTRDSNAIRLNVEGQSVAERKLEGWCRLQINIYDCCSRMLGDDELEMLYEETATIQAEQTKNGKAETVRNLFESNILHLGSKQLNLFPCENGERTIDNPLQGGRFTKCLIDAANSLFEKDELSGADPFLLETAAKIAGATVAFETDGGQKIQVQSYVPIV